MVPTDERARVWLKHPTMHRAVHIPNNSLLHNVSTEIITEVREREKNAFPSPVFSPTVEETWQG